MDLPQDTEVARVRFPVGTADLVDFIAVIERIHGRDLKMREEPKGWLQFLKPAPSEEAGQ